MSCIYMQRRDENKKRPPYLSDKTQGGAFDDITKLVCYQTYCNGGGIRRSKAKQGHDMVLS